MKRPAIVFFIAIFLPSLVLGWLALRTAGEQRVLIERQAAELHQAEADALAAEVRSLIEDQQRLFAGAVREMLKDRNAFALAENFGTQWKRNGDGFGIPFAISPQGSLAYPTAEQGRRERSIATFLQNNADFLSNQAAAEIYQTQDVSKNAEEQRKGETPRQSVNPANPKAPPLLAKQRPTDAQNSQSWNRNVVPQRSDQAAAENTFSKIAPEFSDFQTAVGQAAGGILARFVQDDLAVLLWTRPDPGANWLFGLLLGPQDIRRLVENALPAANGETYLAIIDEKARPAVRSPRDFSADWKHPFVATEIGEMLPHWELALYLANPGKLHSSARLVTITLVLLIALALAAILAGSWFVATDLRRQLALAQKKTDFVSNVSHELKTPLTSIRMFSELLAGDRVTEPAKRRSYLQIIAGESERLARLVNNVLDFARMEKKRRTYDMHDIDLQPVLERTWQAEQARLEESGFAVKTMFAPPPYPVRCDADAIVQIFLNLLSNAEKYSRECREIAVQTSCQEGKLRLTVQDRGDGVPRGLEEKIFDPFFRADDSLSSGVQGSGLGLTLARQIARDHKGDVTFSPRADGGSIFTLILPLQS